MTTKQSVEDLETRVEELEAEEERLEEQAGAARRSVREAEQRLHEIDERSAAIASKSFSGDKEAAREIEDLEEEAVRLTCSLKVDRAAAEDFARMLAENETQLVKARKDIHRERYSELLAQREELAPRAEELAKELKEVLDQQGNLYADAGQELRKAGDHDQANSMHVDGQNATKTWLESQLWPWLQ